MGVSLTICTHSHSIKFEIYIFPVQAVLSLQHANSGTTTKSTHSTKMFTKYREARKKTLESARNENTAMSGGRRVLKRRRTKELMPNNDADDKVREPQLDPINIDVSSAAWVR